MLYKERIFRWMVLIFLAFIWGSSFILMKIGLVKIPHNEMGALRILIASLALLPFGVRHWKSVEPKLWKYLVVVGLCGSGVPAFLFAYAQSHISSSLAGMLNSLVPIFTLLLGIAFFQSGVKIIQIVGVLTGLIGSFFLLYQPGLKFDSNSWYGLYIVVATVCYATSVNTIKRYLSHMSSAVITSVSLFTVGPVCGLYLLFFTGFTERFSFEKDFIISFLCICTLAIFGTGLAIVVFNMLIKRVSALYASSVTYLIPVVAIFWGLVDGETISLIQIGGMTCILGGIYLINV